MKRILVLALGIMLLFGIGEVLATEGSATVTVEYIASDVSGIPSAAEIKWVVTTGTIHTGGAGNATACAVVTTDETDIQLRAIWKKARRIDRVIIVPDGGATVPTTLYDVELRVSTAIASDLLGGFGDNLVNTTTYMDGPMTETNTYPMFIRSLPVIYAINCGASNIFTIYLLIQ